MSGSGSERIPRKILRKQGNAWQTDLGGATIFTRGLPCMTSAKFSDFFTPPPLERPADVGFWHIRICHVQFHIRISNIFGYGGTAGFSL